MAGGLRNAESNVNRRGSGGKHSRENTYRGGKFYFVRSRFAPRREFIARHEKETSGRRIRFARSRPAAEGNRYINLYKMSCYYYKYLVRGMGQAYLMKLSPTLRPRGLR